MSHKRRTWREFLNEQLTEDPDFKERWEKREPQRIMTKLLLKLRIDHNLTQKELAEKLGTTPSHISRIENGNAKVTLDFLYHIVNTFGGEVRFLFPDTMKEQSQNEIEKQAS